MLNSRLYFATHTRARARARTHTSLTSFIFFQWYHLIPFVPEEGNGGKEIRRTKGVPLKIRDQFDPRVFKAAKEEEGTYYSYNKMHPTKAMQVAIGVTTVKLVACLNKKRTVLEGGNHSRPLP